ERLPVDMAALARLAQAQGDPWLQLVAEREWAASESRAGRWWNAEQRLKAALDTCLGTTLVFSCLRLERELTELYLEQHRPAEALPYAWSGWHRAKAAREWRSEQGFLQQLADITRFQHAYASSRAYLEEALARMPEDCAQRTHTHRNLAAVEWEGFRPDSARRALDEAMACERPLGLTGAFVLSDLARARPGPRDGGPPPPRAGRAARRGRHPRTRGAAALHRRAVRAGALARHGPGAAVECPGAGGALAGRRARAQGPGLCLRCPHRRRGEGGAL
ncbi:hypothetical protein ACLESD_53020, partial [Pyxidicoccus sp. 3LFB2]